MVVITEKKYQFVCPGWKVQSDFGLPTTKMPVIVIGW